MGEQARAPFTIEAPLFGHTREQALIGDRLAALIAGSGSLVLVGGDDGRRPCLPAAARVGGHNVASLDEENELLTCAAHGGNYGRLRAIKRRNDPRNVFRGNVNIKP